MSRPTVAINMLWCVPGAVGGSEEYFVRQLHGLSQIGAPYDVTVFAPQGFSAVHRELASEVQIVESNNSCRHRATRVLIENSWLARKTQSFDIVHHGGGTIPSLGNPQTLLTIHDAQYLTYPQYFGAIKLRYLRNRVPSAVHRARAVATPSAYVRSTLAQSFGIDADKVHVVRHGLEQNIGQNATPASELRQRYGLGDSRVLFLPAITHPHKNHEFVLRLLANGWRDPSIVLIMAGGNGFAEQRIGELITELGIADRAIRVGRVNAADRDGLIQLAEALVFPSMYEGFGAPVLEAMALGTPVIASDCASLPEVIGDAGLVLPLTEDAWSGALETVRSRRQDLVQRGYARALEFTAQRSAQDLCVAYDYVLEHN